jgi:hypothetical protein
MIATVRCLYQEGITNKIKKRLTNLVKGRLGALATQEGAIQRDGIVYNPKSMMTGI